MTDLRQHIPLLVTAFIAGITGFYFGRKSDEIDAPSGIFSKSDEDCKMVLVVRTDLGMSPGKIAAQCGHAAVACYESIQRSDPILLERWRSGGQAKIVLQCRDERELIALQRTAIHNNITSRVIHDAGRTEIAAGSATVVGIGPAPKSAVDVVAGHLKLFR